FSTSQPPNSLCILSLDVPPSARLLSPACASDGAEETRAVGTSVTFHLQNPDGPTAAWSFYNNLIVTVKFGKPPEPTFYDKKFEERFTFPEDGRALTISELRLEDAGIYTVKISGAGASVTFALHVYRELPVPTVTCVAQNCSTSNCSYTLGCAVSGFGFGNISYSWSQGGLPWSEGPELLVEEWSPDETLLTCTVQNPVSTRNVTVTSPAALCAGTSRGKTR
ncbi:SLAF5 protein, partial [Bucorvus abyssinicus]|nr:SLAF5 protein [Bucorvus abyssinicus]